MSVPCRTDPLRETHLSSLLHHMIGYEPGDGRNVDWGHKPKTRPQESPLCFINPGCTRTSCGPAHLAIVLVRLGDQTSPIACRGLLVMQQGPWVY